MEVFSIDPKDCKVKSPEGVTAWYYEEKHGFTIVVHVRENEYVHVIISWRAILASVGRYLKGKGKKIVGGDPKEI